jgi:hypothetical protein
VNNLDDREKSKGRRERDAGILSASSIVLVVLPYPRYGPRYGQPDFLTLIGAAEAAGKKIIYVSETAGQQGVAAQVPALKPAAGATAPSPPGKDAAGADRQSRNDAWADIGNHDPGQSTGRGRDKRAVSEILDEWDKIAVRTLGTRAEVRDSGVPVVVVLMVGGKAVDQFPCARRA